MALTEVTPTTDPYDISTQVQEFKEAYYGEDVRDGIINLANKLNNELNDFSTHEFVSVDDTLTVRGAGADAAETGVQLMTKVNRVNPSAEGKVALGNEAVAYDGTATGISHVALGSNTSAGRYDVIAIGAANAEHTASTNQLVTVGNGGFNEEQGAFVRSNAATIDWGGNAWFAGNIKVGGTSYVDPNATPLLVQSDLDNKADKTNLVAENSVSMGRDDESTLGNDSVALGWNVEASGNFSCATGNNTIASGQASHAEGEYTHATSYGAHSEGGYTNASGNDSHAEGEYSVASANNAHAEGRRTIAASAEQHVQGRLNVEDSNGTYAHIVGNGTDISHRSNAHTIDWSGNAWFAGNVKVGGANYAGGSELATKAYVDDSVQPIVGTFTPAQQLSSGSEIKLRQVGNIVYVQGMYGPNASNVDSRLGTGTGVSVPNGSREWLPCVTTDFQSYHAGYVALSKSGSTINFDFYGAPNDQILIINAFYIV